MTFDTAIFRCLSQGQRPDEALLAQNLTAIFDGTVDPNVTAALLLGLEMIGLSEREVRVATQIMRQYMIPVQIDEPVMDIVGTGGTGLHTLSISTASALVCAGAGAKIAKHGNRAASSLTGSADTLTQLGVNLDISPQKAVHSIQQAGIGFLFAPNHHPALRHVGPARKALAIRTIFNMLGPMCNPAGATRMLMGVCDNGWRPLMAQSLNHLGVEHVWIVHGSDGLDEITTTGHTFISEILDGQIREFEINPRDYDIPLADLSALRGGSPRDNANALKALLDGVHNAYRDIALLNSAAALKIANIADNIPHGLQLAAKSIDQGHAQRALDLLIELSVLN